MNDVAKDFMRILAKVAGIIDGLRQKELYALKEY